MKTKEKSEKEVNLSKNEFVRALIILTPVIFSIVLAILFVYISITSTQTIIVLKHQLYQSNSTIINLTHSLVQANATLVQQKTQIINLTNLLNLNESQVIFNKPISIGPRPLMSSCNNFTCFYYRPAANLTLHFNFSHAGYIVINTTSQDNLFVILVQNYSKTWLGTNDTAVIGALNFSVRSLIMPVLPGSAKLTLLTSAYLSNETNVTPYNAQFTITYHS